MIDNIFNNKTNILVLRFLTKFNNQFFSPEEIAKETGAGLRNIYDSLKILSYKKIIIQKISSGKVYYKFVEDSLIKKQISNLFDEERRRLSLRNLKYYKIISEIESKIIKILGSNLIEIILFGSIAKGRDTLNSDIDLCVLVEDKDSKSEQKIKKIIFENKYQNEIQIHLFTLKEFVLSRKEENPLVMDIMKDGLSLIYR